MFILYVGQVISSLEFITLWNVIQVMQKDTMIFFGRVAFLVVTITFLNVVLAADEPDNFANENSK